MCEFDHMGAPGWTFAKPFTSAWVEIRPARQE
jgi:hypothetical protein